MPVDDDSSMRQGLPLQPAEIALECLETIYGAPTLLSLEAARGAGRPDGGTVRQTDLIRGIGASSESAFGRDVERLVEVGAVKRFSSDRRAVFYTITEAGSQMLRIVDAIELWDGLGEDPGMVFEALRGFRLVSKSNQFWANTVMIRLGLGETTLKELAEKLAPALSVPQLRRLLHDCHSLGLVSRRGARGASALFSLTPWGKQMIRVVIVAHDWELRFLPRRAAALPMINAQSGVKITAELLRLDEGFHGPFEFRGELYDVERNATGQAVGSVLRPTGRMACASAYFEAGRAVSVKVSQRRDDRRSGWDRQVSRFLDGSQEGWYGMIGRGERHLMLFGGRLPQNVAKAVHVAYTTPWRP